MRFSPLRQLKVQQDKLPDVMPQVAELNSETAGAKPVLYMTIRYDAANGGPGAHRRFSTSSDQGITWAPMQDVASTSTLVGTVQVPATPNTLRHSTK